MLNPAGMAPPAARYAHAVLSTDANRWLHTSGVVPIRPDGMVPADLAAQAAVVWANIALMLAEARMSATDVVSVTTYVLASEVDNLADVMAARDAFFAGHLAASTLVTVPALAQPAWLVEVAIVAATA